MVRQSFGKVCFTAVATLALASAGMALSPHASSATGLPAGQLFSYTGTDQTYVVPTGVCAVTMSVAGAQGGMNYYSQGGGIGGTGSATIPVAPGESLLVVVGSRGGPGWVAASGGQLPNAPGGVYVGGGGAPSGSGGGGGLTGVWSGATVLIMAGGGGGDSMSVAAGAGGNVGQSGQGGAGGAANSSGGGGGGGGTLTQGGAGGAGGSSPGADGSPGNDGVSLLGGSAGGSTDGGGGGGGGYYGGGGGGSGGQGFMGNFSGGGGGGGGGSGYVISTANNVSTGWAGHDGMGNGSASIEPASSCVLPQHPGKPRSLRAVTTGSSVAVSWLAPRSDGGADITTYKVKLSPGTKSWKTSGLTCTVNGLDPTKRYTVSVKAKNAFGYGPTKTLHNVTG